MENYLDVLFFSSSHHEGNIEILQWTPHRELDMNLAAPGSQHEVVSLLQVHIFIAAVLALTDHSI